MTRRTAASPRRRLVLVGINYSPEFVGIAPYTTAAARHLAETGISVLVLTGLPHYPQWSPPSALIPLVSHERDADVMLRRLRHYVPSKQTAMRRAAYEWSFALNVARQRLPWRPDAVLAVTPTLISAATAARVARRYDAPLGIWIQDLMGPAAAQSGISGGNATASLVTRIERYTFRQAATIAVASSTFGPYLRTLGVPESRVVPLPNWTHISSPSLPREVVRRALGWPADELVVLHSGNIGLKQALGSVVEAAKIADSRGLPVRFVFQGEGSQRNVLRLAARGLASIEFREPAPQHELPNILAAADVLLVNQRADVRDMSLPSKLTSYFHAARPVLAAVSDDSGTADEVRKSHAGCVVEPENPQALLAAIEWIATEPAASRLGDHGRRYAQAHLSEDAALTRVSCFVEGLLQSKGR